MPDKQEQVVVFIDHQNMYKGARRSFFQDCDNFIYGQFNPLLLGQIACNSPLPGVTRILKEVRIYTGQASPVKNSRSYSASRKQFAAWGNSGVNVNARPLRYPPTYPAEKPQEKGIDVQLAIDFISMAIDGEYNIGVIASTDTDLIPAIDFVVQRYTHDRRVEVMAWSARINRNPCLKSNIKQIWCHWVDKQVYDQIADLTDYTH